MAAPRRARPARRASAPCVAHQHPPVHDRRPHVVAARRRRPGARADRTSASAARCHRHDDDVGALAGLERADAIGHPERRAPSIVAIASARRPAARAGHPCRACAAAPPAAWPRTCRGRCCWPRRRCRAPRDAGRPQLRAPARAAGQLHVALGVVRDATRVPQHLDVRVVSHTACAASVPGPRNRATSRYAAGGDCLLAR
jgi:hypothetical protein